MRVMRFPEASASREAIDAWFDQEPATLYGLARRWFSRMRRGDDVRELMHDGQPTACVADAAFAYVAVYRAHVNVGFFNGAVLSDPAGLLEGSGKFMRHVKLRPDAEPDAAALEALIEASYRDMQRREREET